MVPTLSHGLDPTTETAMPWGQMRMPLSPALGDTLRRTALGSKTHQIADDREVVRSQGRRCRTEEMGQNLPCRTYPVLSA